MKYLHIISSMDPRAGGPCQGIRNLTARSRDAGHSVEVVCLDDPGSEYLTHENITVHALGKGRGLWSYHPALRPWLEQNLSRFDAVILNGLWQYPGHLMSRLVNRLDTPPYFVFPHGMLDPWFQRAPERRLKAIRNWFYWKLIEQHVIARAAAIFFTCAEEMRMARDTFSPYQPQRQINVGYGVLEPPAFNERMVAAFAEKCPGLNSRPYFLFLSRIHPKKGVGLMIKAYAEVYSEKLKAETRKVESRDGGNRDLGAEGNIQRANIPALVIAGPGLDTDYGRQMQRLAQDYGLRTTEVKIQQSAVSNPTSDFRPQVLGLMSQVSSLGSQPLVLFPGMLTADAKWGALYRAEAFVLTSHQENFGIAVVEALACATPVLISNQINIWQEIEQEQAGLVAPDTLAGAEELFRRWESLTYEAQTTMTRAAQASFMNRFGMASVAQNLLVTMDAIIKEKQKR